MKNTLHYPDILIAVIFAQNKYLYKTVAGWWMVDLLPLGLLNNQRVILTL